jgi:hypothetical protein
LLGLEVVYGPVIQHEDEFADFMLAAEDFYNDYKSQGKSSDFEMRSAFPFWRYIIHYSQAGLDEAACNEKLEEQRAEDLAQLGSALAIYWPLLPALVTQAWRQPALTTRVDAGVQTEDLVPPTRISTESSAGAAPLQRPSYFR